MQASPLLAKLNSIFKLAENQTSVSQELLAGLATFLTMSYIMFVNPIILGASGMHPEAVYVATCLVTIIGTTLVGLMANYPIAIAPAVPVNIFFTYTVVHGLGYSWHTALGIVFIASIACLVISLTKIRSWIVESMPEAISVAIAVGIGIFIALIALHNAGIVIKPSGKSLIGLGSIASLESLLFFLGLIVIVVLDYFRVHGAIVLSILLISGISLLFGLSPFYGIFALPPSLDATFMAADFKNAWHIEYIPLIFTFLLMIFFDATGTLLGVLRQSLFHDNQHRAQRISRALVAESIATTSGVMLGTVSTSPYIESAAGIEAGGRTGLTALTVSFCFIIALFLSPLARSIPPYAVAPALLYVGILMIKNIAHISLDDPTDFIPCLLIVLMIPFTFSIVDGLGLGILAYVLLKILTKKAHQLNAMLCFIALIFLIYFCFLFH